MTDYTELVKALRIRSGNLCPGDICDRCEAIHFLCSDKVMHDAADAIEALQAEIRESMQKCAECGENEPKRGEIVRCKECIHFTQGGWCDREFDWFPVDENDFCSMAEKMEVQDEVHGEEVQDGRTDKA